MMYAMPKEEKIIIDISSSSSEGEISSMLLLGEGIKGFLVMNVAILSVCVCVYVYVCMSWTVTRYSLL